MRESQSVASVTVAAIHPLLTREVRPILNWYEFSVLWQEATTYEEMLGLLHIGFSLPYGSVGYVDRLIFYFNIADGWMDECSFQAPRDGDKEYQVVSVCERNETKKPCEFRRLLAHKAFDILCRHFFKAESDKSDGRFGTKQGKWIASERLLPVIQHFFRVKENEREEKYGNCNLHFWPEQRNHNEEHAIAFLLKLAKYIWEWKEKESWGNWIPSEMEKEQAAEVRSRLDSAKPWMIEVLAGFQRLDVLRKWLLELNEPCLTKLREIAMHNKLSPHDHPVTHYRQVASIEEALLADSKAAWLLKEREMKQGVCEQLLTD